MIRRPSPRRLICATILQIILLHERADQCLGFAIFFQGRDIDLDIKVTRVGHDRAIFHHFEMMLVDHVDVTGNGHKNIADFSGFFHRHDPVTIHDRFERWQRIDFGHDHIRAHALGSQRQPTATPAITCHDKYLASQQNIGGANDAINGGLTGAIAVVEKVFGHGIIHRDDRECQRTIRCHGTQTDDTRGGFFGSANNLWQAGRAGPCAGCDTRSAPSSMVMCGL